MYSCRLLRRPHSFPSFHFRHQNALAVDACRPFSTSRRDLYKAGNNLPPRPTLADPDIKVSYVKGSGPGGQKINKTSSAAQLTHIPTGIVVKCQATRSKSQNYTIARRLLAEKVELLQKGDDSRAAKVVERKSRKKKSADKKKRRKYRRLAGEKDGQEGEVDDEEVEDDDLDLEEVATDELVDSKLDRPESGNNVAPKRPEARTT